MVSAFKPRLEVAQRSLGIRLAGVVKDASFASVSGRVPG